MAEQKEYTDATPFDILNNYIYIIDMHDYEMLFMNKLARESFNMSHEDYAGKKCYEILRGLSEPCVFCGAAGMDMEKPCRWQSHNKQLNEYHQVQDVPLRFRGHDARMEMSVDVTTQVQHRQKLKASLDTETAMLEAIRILSDNREIETALNKMLSYLAICFGAKRTYVYELQDESFVNTYEWRRPDNISKFTKGHVIQAADIARWLECFRKHVAVCVSDITMLDDKKEYSWADANGISAYIMAPLEIEGKLVGFLGMDDPVIERLETISVMLLTLAYFTSITMANAENRNALELLSYTDAMTGVANRNAYIRDVRQYKQRFATKQMSIGVIYFDLNGLKTVNDTEGHEAGDVLIKELASAITSVFRRTEVYRIGGDEFVVLVAGIGENEFNARLDEVRKCIAGSSQISVSIGSDWAEDGAELDDLISSADNVMYEQKQIYYEDKKRK